jgi:aminoglycoside phosphotransferase (APT) family kinase protein
VEDRLRRWLEAQLGLEAPALKRIEHGWDSVVFDVDGEWIVRVPRRPEVREGLRVEARLLPDLARVLSVPVPRPAAVEDAEDFFVAYRKLHGDPLEVGVDSSALAGQAGELLATLHALPSDVALRAGLEDVGPAEWRAQRASFVERCSEALPLFDTAERARAQRLFDDLLSSVSRLAETVLIHGDLGPEHILHQGTALTGVIDWTDARLGDPALDFAWLLSATGEQFWTALLREYRGRREATAELIARARLYHRVGPWYEVLYGLEHGRSHLVESGLAGIRHRLPH